MDYVINVMKPDNTVTTYAFVGDTIITKEEFESKRDTYLSKLKQHLTVSESIWSYHSSSGFKDVVMIQDYIFLDDTIHTIKLKLFNALQQTNIGVEDIYLFCETKQHLDLKHIYKLLTNQRRDILTGTLMNEFLLNFDCIDTPMADKDNYSYDEFINDKNASSDCGFTKPMGYNQLHTMFTANPFKVVNYDNDHVLRKDYVYYPNQLLIEFGQIKSNVIYACLSDIVLQSHKEKGLEEINTIKIYFPELYKQNLKSIEGVESSRGERYDKTITRYTELIPQYKSLNSIQDIYTRDKDLLKFIKTGLRELSVVYHPSVSFDIPIHFIFKIIHSSHAMPMIKFNPGKKQENLYRLYTGDQIAANGRKVPVLARSKILQLIKESTNKNSVTCYIINEEYLLLFEFNSIGEILIRYTCELNIHKQLKLIYLKIPILNS